MRYDAPPGGHDDTFMALAIPWQAIADSRKRRFNPDMARVFAEANASLSGSGWRGAGDEPTPSEYPKRGGNPWDSRRWSM